MVFQNPFYVIFIQTLTGVYRYSLQKNNSVDIENKRVSDGRIEERTDGRTRTKALLICGQ